MDTYQLSDKRSKPEFNSAAEMTADERLAVMVAQLSKPELISYDYLLEHQWYLRDDLHKRLLSERPSLIERNYQELRSIRMSEQHHEFKPKHLPTNKDAVDIANRNDAVSQVNKWEAHQIEQAEARWFQERYQHVKDALSRDEYMRESVKDPDRIPPMKDHFNDGRESDGGHER